MRLTGRPPSARLRRFAAFSLLAGLLLAPTAALNAAPPLPAPAQVSLKGGHLLTGTVTKSVKIEGKPFSVIETDFGEILAPQSEITGTVPAAEAGDTFLATEIRIVRLAGTVERRSAGAQEWTKVGPLDPEFTGQPRPRILPGDTVRTGADGQLDVMLHRDAWVRLEADTEVEFSTAAAKGSLSLLRGATVQDVTGRPRGQTFRVTTPSTTLGVRGTRFGVFVDAEKQGVAVLKGVVRVGAATDVAEGQEGIWTDPATVTVSPLSEEQRRRIDMTVHRLPGDDMAYVPGGTYVAGVTDPELTRPDTAYKYKFMLSEEEARKFGGPGHKFFNCFATGGPVEVSPYLIDRREITRGEFSDFLASTSDTAGGKPTDVGREREPAIDVSHSRAQSFAKWAGKALPTLTQVQVAARGRDERLFPWGSTIRKEHLALVLGSWHDASAASSWCFWVPPASLPAVDAPTVDVSPFGVRALVSAAPEWVRRGVDREPISPYLIKSDRGQLTFDGEFISGVGGSLFTLVNDLRRPDSVCKVGFRCVVDLGGRR